MKRMTFKEFKEVFNKVADFEIYGWEGILCMLEGDCRANGKIAKEMGYQTVYQREKERAEYIHEYLRQRGYYNVEDLTK